MNWAMRMSPQCETLAVMTDALWVNGRSNNSALSEDIYLVMPIYRTPLVIANGVFVFYRATLSWCKVKILNLKHHNTFTIKNLLPVSG